MRVAAVLLLPFVVVVLLLALPPVARCQQSDGGDPAPPPAVVQVLESAPPLPPAAEDLHREIERVGNQVAGEVQRKYGFCVANVKEDFNQTFNFTSDPSFASDCMDQTGGQMFRMLCGKAEVELYIKSLASTSSRNIVRISRNCNKDSWALGCQPGWACSTFGDESADESVPSRAVNCRPCCPGFFCPRGLTCMMRPVFKIAGYSRAYSSAIGYGRIIGGFFNNGDGQGGASGLM